VAVFCQIKSFKRILYVKYYFEVARLLFLSDLSENPTNFEEKSM
jgi:hypothetical protein